MTAKVPVERAAAKVLFLDGIGRLLLFQSEETGLLVDPARLEGPGWPAATSETVFPTMLAECLPEGLAGRWSGPPRMVGH